MHATTKYVTYSNAVQFTHYKVEKVNSDLAVATYVIIRNLSQ